MLCPLLRSLSRQIQSWSCANGVFMQPRVRRVYVLRSMCRTYARKRGWFELYWSEELNEWDMYRCGYHMIIKPMSLNIPRDWTTFHERSNLIWLVDYKHEFPLMGTLCHVRNAKFSVSPNCPRNAWISLDITVQHDNRIILTDEANPNPLNPT